MVKKSFLEELVEAICEFIGEACYEPPKPPRKRNKKYHKIVVVNKINIKY